MLKAVIDSNVWISALLVPGKPRQVIDHIESGIFTFFYPAQLIAELESVPSKPALSQRIQSNDLSMLLDLISHQGRLIELDVIPALSRDPKDDPFLECVRLADCDYLVTGDKDLLVLQTHGRAAIITPAQFFEILAASA